MPQLPSLRIKGIAALANRPMRKQRAGNSAPPSPIGVFHDKLYWYPFRTLASEHSVSLDDGAVEWGSKGLLSLFARKRNAFSWSFHSMLREMARFNREAPLLLLLEDDDPRKVRYCYSAKTIEIHFRPYCIIR